ncbi:MAG: cytochrome c family protein [Thermodesulfovibrionales bacterium]|nr:cytochrome c family protein [Thermodesulfovibrionales bacterium]
MEKRGKAYGSEPTAHRGIFFDVGKFNFETLNISIRYTLFILLFSCIMHAPLAAEQMGNKIPRYVGSDACKSCHENEYKYFMTYAKKASSFRSIERVKKGLTEEEIKGCYTCHTTGYGKPGGFISAEKTPHLKNAGCEVCHGPGEFHVSTGSPQHIKRKMKIEACEVCHTSERVRAFRYKPMIHGGAH